MIRRNRNIRGERVERPISEYPYSYDAFVIFKDPEWNPHDEVVYSDRLRQSDHAKFDECCMAVWKSDGQQFYDRSPEQIEKFLRLYFGDDQLKLTGVEQECNVSNGYPYWIFFFRKGSCLR